MSCARQHIFTTHVRRLDSQINQNSASSLLVSGDDQLAAAAAAPSSHYSAALSWVGRLQQRRWEQQVRLCKVNKEIRLRGAKKMEEAEKTEEEAEVAK